MYIDTRVLTRNFEYLNKSMIPGLLLLLLFLVTGGSKVNPLGKVHLLILDICSKISLAFSSCPLTSSHLGDSGTKLCIMRERERERERREREIEVKIIQY